MAACLALRELVITGTALGTLLSATILGKLSSESAPPARDFARACARDLPEIAH